MIKKIIQSSFIGFALLAPSLAFGQYNQLTNHTNDLNGLIAKITGYLNSALVLMMSVAVVMFIFWVINYYIKPNDDRAKAGNYVLYSLIGFFVMLSVWGLVNILRRTFGFQSATAPSVDEIRGLLPQGSTSIQSNAPPTTVDFVPRQDTNLQNAIEGRRILLHQQ